MAPAKKSAAGRTKRMVGQKQGEVETEATNVPKGGSAQPSTDEAAAEAQAKADDDRIWITATNTSSFQLVAEKRDANGNIVTPERTVTFGPTGLYECTEGDEVHTAFEKVLSGQWSDAGVGGDHFQTIARMAGIGIKSFGLESSPFPNWDDANDDQVVGLGVAVGALSSADSVRKALRYEKQSLKRTPKRAIRESVVTQLEGLLAGLESAPEQQQSVIHATGGNTPQSAQQIQVGTAGIGFAVGSTELG